MSAVDFCQRFSVRVEFPRSSAHSLKGEISVSYLFIQKHWESSVLSDPVEAVDIAIPVQGSGEGKILIQLQMYEATYIIIKKKQQQNMEATNWPTTLHYY